MIIQGKKKRVQLGRNRHTAVIVQFKKGFVFDKHWHRVKREIHPHKTGSPVHLPLIRSVAVTVPREAISKLYRCKHVYRVFPDRKRRMLLDIATPAIGASAAQAAGLTGRGVGIAIIDTGVYPHPDLTRPANRIAAFKDFVGGRTKAYDDNGHGTHCAGDAAGNGFSSGGRYRGPAPQARIIGVKVLDAQGTGYDSTIIRGIDWCIRNRKRYGIRIASLSLGGPAPGSCGQDPLCQAVNRAVRRGLVIVAAAGNEGPRPGTISSPGTSPLAITAGAADDRRSVRPLAERVAGFSSRGPAKGGAMKPDLVAPGVGIVSLRVPGSVLDRLLPSARRGRRYFALSGTSMATPLTAGAAAQLLQRYPGLTPAGVKRLLKRHAIRLGRPMNAQGSGLLNMRFLKH
ncbi:S8 family peptidase [Paenibacillus filicis]|uniref:S8 family peptidase n=1 Tax=Paenibacillus gyeongsangnamensis TaxID=3388067 RepID=A0ABT4QB05_9BACL|nr:S8 family peptidase [Paenibacillus filicis]MCZ8514059.1 S8 family peptidase [Paenibacillus filicis]